MSWMDFFSSESSIREKEIEHFKMISRKNIDDMLNECKKHKRFRLRYSFSSMRGRTIINAYSMDGTLVGNWPQPIEGYDYPTGTLPKVK